MKNFISAANYIKSENDLISLNKLMMMFENYIKPDGVRSRAYLKLIWNRRHDQIEVAKNQFYYQSSRSNALDGGKVRNFARMNARILDLSIMKNVMSTNLKIIKDFEPLKTHQFLTLGLHFIQYKVDKFNASYSSPDSLHIDDEPLVFVHLLGLTSNAWGGDNLIADYQTKEITHVVRLEKPFETLMLTQNYYHAVTPLGARDGEAVRNILLFTVEPSETQMALLPKTFVNVKNSVDANDHAALSAIS